MILKRTILFITTFGAFMTRAHDQIRMAAIGQSAIKLVGSHVGVSIGQDGPSQMALEDIAMMRAIPGSIVLYPCDVVSTTKLIEQMIGYRDGISYLRTTRAATPVVYDTDEQFLIGGCKILCQSNNDVACIVAAGITVFEALKAYDQLKKQNIFVSVIDLYSIKPLDLTTVAAVAHASNNRVITVEDHYIQGGIGELVATGLINTDITVSLLAIKQLPQSGDPADLISTCGIDAAHIIQVVLQGIKEY
jgi:transketolase